jgi:hypothetical protein
VKVHRVGRADNCAVLLSKLVTQVEAEITKHVSRRQFP